MRAVGLTGLIKSELPDGQLMKIIQRLPLSWTFLSTALSLGRFRQAVIAKISCKSVAEGFAHSLWPLTAALCLRHERWRRVCAGRMIACRLQLPPWRGPLRLGVLGPTPGIEINQ